MIQTINVVSGIVRANEPTRRALRHLVGGIVLLTIVVVGLAMTLSREAAPPRAAITPSASISAGPELPREWRWTREPLDLNKMYRQRQ